ncbi:MAG TPA: dipeptidase [Pyrinomonadaceae bacterium]|nr:dipeptidase [Pyrinomonadaceae bacterium]
MIHHAHRKSVLLIITALALFLLNNCRMNTETGNQTASSNPSKPSPSDALSIHRRAISIDMHADTTQRMYVEGLDINERLPDGHLDAVRMREGGLDAQFFSIWVNPEIYGDGGQVAVRSADDQIRSVHELVKKHPDTWELASSAADIRRIVSGGKLAALMGLEGGYALDERLENVEKYYKLGVRYLSVTWSVSTKWAGSSGDSVGQSRGLNDFGRQVISEMNRLGVMVDVSHVSDRTFWDIVNTSTKPIIATHSNCRAIANVPRNLTDEMIQAIAKSGGVVCVVFFPEFLEPGWSQKRQQVDAQIVPLLRKASDAEAGDAAHKKVARDRVRIAEYARRLPPVTVSRIADHIDHIVKLVGIDHVGVGSDFDGIQAVPSDLSSVAQLPNLTVELLRRGYSEEDIDKILGGNILRVMEEVERH